MRCFIASRLCVQNAARNWASVQDIVARGFEFPEDTDPARSVEPIKQTGTKKALRKRRTAAAKRMDRREAVTKAKAAAAIGKAKAKAASRAKALALPNLNHVLFKSAEQLYNLWLTTVRAQVNSE